MIAVQKISYGLDEMAVAGGLVSEPIKTVKCKTVDLFVPAESEIVIEGLLNTEWIEPEGPFGESHGYMHPRQLNPFMEVTAITHRKNAIYVIALLTFFTQLKMQNCIPRNTMGKRFVQNVGHIEHY